MKTTENKYTKDSSLQLSNDYLDDEVKTVKPLKSLRPMKSMVRVQSFRPKRIELGKTKRRVVKI